VSDRALVGGGHRFTAAPFSGYYMGTEIASRNFGDEGRYNLLPLIAERMGIDSSNRSTLWKDRALVEINTAVLHFFREAGVAIVDHHTASAQFMKHVEKEEKCGRKVPGDWSWLVPPMSGSACPVFHHHALTQNLAQGLGDDPRHDVGGAAGCEGHHQTHRLVRIGLGQRRASSPGTSGQLNAG
jgi:nitric-oxide synthase